MSELDHYSAPDKQLHLASGFAIGAIAAFEVDHLAPKMHPALKYVCALIPVVVAAMAKEAYDHQHPSTHDCDARDALATTAGGALGVVLVNIQLRF